MKDSDLFESYKSNIEYPVIAELKTVNLKPVISYDKYELFGNPRFYEGWKIELPWRIRSVELDYEFLHGIFFHKGVLIEEHHISLPPFGVDGHTFWWGHGHLMELAKGLNIKFYGR
jgi:hypothetical protein